MQRNAKSCMKMKDFFEFRGVLQDQCEGVRRLGDLVCLSVTHFSQNWFISFFLILCRMLGVHRCKKVTKPDFSAKFSFGLKWAKSAQNDPKIDFLDFCEKLNHEMYGQIA